MCLYRLCVKLLFRTLPFFLAIGDQSSEKRESEDARECVCVCMSVYVCMCVSGCAYVRMSVCVYVCMSACVYEFMSVCVYECMCVCVYDSSSRHDNNTRVLD